MIDIGLWYLFPVSLLIATLAMMSGIGGAVMFSPVFMLLVGLDPISTFTIGLFVELFGFTSGMIGYWKRKLIDFTLAKKLAIVSIPSVIGGIVIAQFMPLFVLKLTLGALLLYLSVSFLIKQKKCSPKHPACMQEPAHLQNYKSKPVSSTVIASSSFGGLLLGAISSGLGEINEYNFLKKLQLPLPIASGTSVFLVAISAFVGILIHVTLSFFSGNTLPFSQLINILLFVLPGVVLGAQVGVFMSQKVNLEHMGRFIGGLFLVLFAMIVITLF